MKVVYRREGNITMIKEIPICFSFKPLIGVLYTNDLKPKFIREQFSKESFIRELMTW